QMITRTSHLTPGHPDALAHQPEQRIRGRPISPARDRSARPAANACFSVTTGKFATRAATPSRRSIAAAAGSSTCSPAITGRSCPHMRQRAGTSSAKEDSNDRRRADDRTDRGAQIFERYQQSGIDYLVDYLEGEQSAIDLNFYPAHERAALINLASD